MRYAASRAFPPYAFLPGRDPHPTRDPRGHSFGHDEQAQAYLAPARWPENEAYLFGVDLYNHGFLWEAHEAWEGLWHAAKSDAAQADHLQGLIQCAAGCLKIPMEQPAGVARLIELGTTKLERVAAREGSPYMGVELTAWIEAMRDFAASSPNSIEGRPRLVLAAQA